MEYTFRQIPKAQDKKMVVYILLTAILSLALMFVVLFFTHKFKLSEPAEMVLGVSALLIPAGMGIYLVFQKLAVHKTVKIYTNHLEVTEIHPPSLKKEGRLSAAQSKAEANYHLTPDMIKSIRYISDSDSANYLEILTHDETKELIIPESVNKIAQFNLFRTEIEKWFQTQQGN